MSARERVELARRPARRVLPDPAGDVGEHELELGRRGGVHVPGGGDRVRPLRVAQRPWMRVGGQ